MEFARKPTAPSARYTGKQAELQARIVSAYLFAGAGRRHSRTPAGAVLVTPGLRDAAGDLEPLPVATVLHWFDLEHATDAIYFNVMRLLM